MGAFWLFTLFSALILQVWPSLLLSPTLLMKVPRLVRPRHMCAAFTRITIVVRSPRAGRRTGVGRK